MSLVEAARLLNTTPEALRKRLQRGKSIRGTKRDGEWYVRLPAAVASRGQAATGSVSGRVLDAFEVASGRGQDVGRDTAGHGQDASTPLVDELRHQRDVLEATVADLRARCDAHQQAEAELRKLLALALQRPALPAPVLETSNERLDSNRPWWAALLWWRR